jgi:nucleoside-diphosphate-sugar epimerase
LTVSNEVRMGDVLCSCGSTNLAKGLLGYEARVSLRDGLERVVEWFKRHG